MPNVFVVNNVARRETARCRIQPWVLPPRVLRGNEKSKLVSDQSLSHDVNALFVITPLVAGITPTAFEPLAATRPCYHTIRHIAEVC